MRCCGRLEQRNGGYDADGPRFGPVKTMARAGMRFFFIGASWGSSLLLARFLLGVLSPNRRPSTSREFKSYSVRVSQNKKLRCGHLGSTCYSRESFDLSHFVSHGHLQRQIGKPPGICSRGHVKTPAKRGRSPMVPRALEDPMEGSWRKYKCNVHRRRQ
jgi:hypothetical protein